MFPILKSLERRRGADLYGLVHRKADYDIDRHLADSHLTNEPRNYCLSKSARYYCSVLLLATDMLAGAAGLTTLTYIIAITPLAVGTAALIWAGLITASKLLVKRRIQTSRDLVTLACTDSLVCAALLIFAAVQMLAFRGFVAGPGMLLSLSIGCATLVLGRLATILVSACCRAYWTQHVLLIGTAQAAAQQLRNQPAEAAQSKYAGAILIGDGTVALPLLGRITVQNGAATVACAETLEPESLIVDAAVSGRQARRVFDRVDRIVLLEKGLGNIEKQKALVWLERFSHEVHVLQSEPSHSMQAQSHEFGVLAKSATIQPLGLCMKRTLDVLIALTALLVLLPALIIVAILIRVESKGPALFRQPRLGCDNLPFTVFKFRTMRQNSAIDGSVQAVLGDSRVTRLGAILRKTSVDELPQLLNVLNGSMSLVGPRPHPLIINSRFEPLISSYAARHSVLPGITGWAQINGARGETPTVEAMQRRVDLDLEYVRRQSLLLDLWILCRTVLSVVQARNVY